MDLGGPAGSGQWRRPAPLNIEHSNRESSCGSRPRTATPCGRGSDVGLDLCFSPTLPLRQPADFRPSNQSFARFGATLSTFDLRSSPFQKIAALVRPPICGASNNLVSFFVWHAPRPRGREAKPASRIANRASSHRSMGSWAKIPLTPHAPCFPCIMKNWEARQRAARLAWRRRSSSCILDSRPALPSKRLNQEDFAARIQRRNPAVLCLKSV